MVYIEKNIRITILYRKISRKVTFPFKVPYEDAKEVFFGKFVLFRYSFALKSIFIIKVYFSTNTDISNYAHETLNEKIDYLVYSFNL